MFGSMNTYTSMLDRASMEVERMSVSVVGTGPFGLALSSRLAEAGAEVRLGSRDVNNVRGQVAPGVKLVHNKEAMREGRVVILAIPCQFQSKLGSLSELRPGTVVVDCSNRYSKVKDGKLTHAEELARLLPPTVSLVKAFNMLEVTDLVGDKAMVKDVPIVSDNPGARVLVSSLVTMLGHRPVDMGDLAMSRRLENSPLTLFPGYRIPVLVSLCTWSLLHLLAWLATLLCHHGNVSWDIQQVMNSIFLTINTTCSSHALMLVAISHLGLVILDYIFLIRGTKYTCIPTWLDTWSYNIRCKLYPLLLVSITLHGWLALFLPHTSVASLPPGVTSYLCILLLCLSQHPAVSSLMSRHERTVTSTILTWTSLILSTVHAIMADWDTLVTIQCLPSPHQISLLLPVFTIFLQAPLMLPWIRKKLINIRRGHIYRGIYEQKI